MVLLSTGNAGPSYYTPVGALPKPPGYGSSSSAKSSTSSSGYNRSAGRVMTKAIQGQTAQDDYNQAAMLMAAAQQAQQAGGGGGYGSGGGGYGGGGYGGGGGGGGGFDTSKMQADLTTQRDAARAALPGYLSEYNTSIGKIGTENAAQSHGYGTVLANLLQQLQNEASAQDQRLQGDVAAQGGNVLGLQQASGQNQFATSSLGAAQQMYNARMAQLQGTATADHKAAGAAVNQASNASLDQSYMQALLALQARAG